MTGLQDYAALGDVYSSRLKTLYLESELHPFGPALDLIHIGDATLH